MVIDPPWGVQKNIREVAPNQKRELDYETMDFGDIIKLLRKDIFPKGNKDCNFFVWTVESYLSLVINELSFLGYKKHCTFIWDKDNGMCPAFSVRYSHEYLLWFYQGKFQLVNELFRGSYKTVIREAPREHSRKPDKAYIMLNHLFPKSKKLDVFSREKREGWDQYGNQCDHFKD